jgi:P27 family predicted phage terminase small subunit
MRGPKPKPTREKRATGNPGKRKLNDQEPDLPIPGASFDDPPAILQGDVRASAEWRRIAPQLRISRTISEADIPALIAACQEWSRYLTALEKSGGTMVVTTKTGYPMPNPYLGIANKALSQCIKLWAELGCTPSSRSRVRMIGGGPLPDVDPDLDPIEAELSAHRGTTH